MAIVKQTSTRLVKFGYNFESVPRQVAQKIKNPIALAYWVFLLTRPDDWVIRRKELMEHFSIGRGRHDAAMAELRELGLAWTQVERNEKGQICGRQLMIGAIPIDDLPHLRSENPQLGKTVHEGKPSMRENRPHTDIQSITDIQIATDTPIVPYGDGVDDDGFDAFYAIYPKKVGKDAARKAWAKLKPSPELAATIAQNIKDKVDKGEWCTGARKAYIPGPAPCLNQRKWEDEIIPHPDYKPTVDYSAIAREAVDLT